MGNLVPRFVKNPTLLFVGWAFFAITSIVFAIKGFEGELSNFWNGCGWLSVASFQALFALRYFIKSIGDENDRDKL